MTLLNALYEDKITRSLEIKNFKFDTKNIVVNNNARSIIPSKILFSAHYSFIMPVID
jgi:hypothetical protein